ncbi:glycerophosphodiester phosphodiesterase [Microseira wollei]|uniref:Glycerophosphodiester phosphodiesterase n=1 Tax=Microseira wollei NIES-4236 TaxID=2530354 RepID=A0AAV3XD01_9CYAN|nr:glycerophosphodiester phosphodiesterase family protein [Microseira wollei]GET38700.1 putative glycerophosphodiester phosphodiesterase [Microseira wollei NIES-4236]
MPLEIIAHRGYSGIAPENTLAAFYAAIEKGANSIEFDVQLCSDGEFVIIHDATLERTSNGIGNVREKTLKELKQLDAGSWFDPKFALERIPTLREGLEAIKNLDKFAYPEVKGSENWTDRDAEKFVQILVETGWEERCIVLCFKDKLLEQVRERSSKIILGYLVADAAVYAEKLPKAAADGRAVMMSQYNTVLKNPFLIEASRNQGIDVGVWTVDSQSDLQKLVNLGVVRIATNSLVEKQEFFPS